MRTLYFFAEFGTLRGNGRAPCHCPVAPPDDVARSLQGMLRASGAAVGVAAVCPGLAQRQCAQVDGSDAGSRDRAGVLSSVPTLHYRCAVEGRPRLAAPAGGAARTRRPADHRRHEFPQTRAPLGRGGAAVLWDAGQGRQLPGGGDGRPVDRGARVPARGGALPARGVVDGGGSGARADSGRCPVSGEVAPSADLAPPGAGEWYHRHGRVGGCRIWRQHVVSPHVAPAARAVCGGRVVVADRVPGASAPRAPAARRAGGARARGRRWRRACNPPRSPPSLRLTPGGGASVGATAARRGSGPSSVSRCG